MTANPESIYLEEDARIERAEQTYHAAVDGAMPADDASSDEWRDFHELDRVEWQKCRGVFWDVQEARRKRAPEATR